MPKRPFGLIYLMLYCGEKTSRSQTDERGAVTKGQQTKQAIVRKAAPLFNQKGFEGTSLSDLMAATGLRKGGIYRHFSDKEELAAAAFDYSWQKAVSGRLDGVENVQDSVNRLKKMIDNFVEMRSGLVPGGCPLMNTAVEADDGNPILRARARKAMQTWTTRLSRIASQGIAKHEIDSRVQPKKLSQWIIGSLEGALLISRLQKDDQPLHNARQSLHEHLEQNIRARHPRSK
jgi:TetR/AcrR family transcriptional regulator, transcriptional repressor for nem operon